MTFIYEEKKAGQLLKSSDWNTSMKEIVRLEQAKLDQIGGKITGTLSIAGNLGLGIDNPTAKLEISGDMKATGNLTITSLKIGQGLTISKIASDFSDPTDTNIPTTKGIKTYIDNQITTINNTLTQKASLTGSNSQSFSASSLSATSLSVTTQLKLQGTTKESESNEIFFSDNGQIRSLDNYHRILFRRSEDILELREYGTILFSAGSQDGNELARMVVNKDGNVGIGTKTPTSKLEVSGDIKASGNLSVNTLTATGTITANSFNGKGAIIVGMIVMWSGLENNIPVGWAVCNGQTVNNRKTPDLRNRFIIGAGTNSPNTWGEPDYHNHSVDPPNATGSTSTNGSHTHYFPPNWYKNNAQGGDGRSILDVYGENPKTSTTQSSGDHSHVVYVDIPAFSSGASSGDNKPRWYALCFIMYVG